MAELFANNPQNPRDKYVVSTFALMMCAPGRNMEFHDLPVNCLHREKDRNGVERLGIRFNAGKGYGSDIKWVPSSMVAVAEEAVKRLIELSAPARKLAKELEKRQDTNPIKLPSGWPWKNKERGIRWSNALYCMRKNELHNTKSVSESKLWSPGKSHFSFELTIRSNVRNHRSIWARHGYMYPDGSPIMMTSHQIRHYLNTLAQRGELGQLDIARWSGRANVNQNRTYNHVSEDEILDKVKEVFDSQSTACSPSKIKINTPVTLSDLGCVGDGIAHITEFGFCVHDFSMVPCQKHRDCINCTELVCIKGDSIRLSRLKIHRGQIQGQLDKANEGIDSEYYGAGRWYEHQKLTLNRVNELISVLESDSIAEGAVIRLKNNSEFSLLKRELSAKEAGNMFETASMIDITSVKEVDLGQASLES